MYVNVCQIVCMSERAAFFAGYIQELSFLHGERVFRRESTLLALQRDTQ